MEIINQYTTRYGYREERKALALDKKWNFCIPLGFYKKKDSTKFN